MSAEIPEIREVSESQVTTVIAEDLEIKGTIRLKSSVMLKGVFEGEIFSDGLIIVGSTAAVTASIHTKTFISHGSVTGNVIATEQIVLKNSAAHNGDLNSPFVMIENGAVFNGSCKMERKSAAAGEQAPVYTSQETTAVDEPSYGSEEDEGYESTVE